MKPNKLLVSASVVSVVLFSLHLAGDIVRGYEKGSVWNLTAIPIFAFWLYGALVANERRSGQILMVLFALLSLAVPLIHMRGKGLRGEEFFFIWTTIAIGVSGLFSLIVAARNLRR